MHIFSLINKAYNVIKREVGKDKSGIFLDTRDTGTYVTAAHNNAVFITIQLLDEEIENLPILDEKMFLNVDYVRDASKSSYTEIDADDHMYMFIQRCEIADAIKDIDYEPLYEIHTIEGVEVFAPLSKSKGIRKLLKDRENLKQVFIIEGLQCFTTGHWLVQRTTESEYVTVIPLLVLEIISNLGDDVEWLYASGTKNTSKLRFHGMRKDGGIVTIGCENQKITGPNVMGVQPDFKPSSFFSIKPEGLYKFISKIGKSFSDDDLIYLYFDAEAGLVLSLCVTLVSPDINEVVHKKHTDLSYSSDYILSDNDGFLGDEFKVAWNAVYLTSCLNAVGELIEFIVPIKEDGTGDKPCALIGESADALVMPKRL